MGIEGIREVEMGKMKDKVDIRLVKAYAPVCITLLFLFFVPRHAGVPPWIKWGIGIFGVWSIFNCFMTLAAIKKNTDAPASKSLEE